MKILVSMFVLVSSLNLFAAAPKVGDFATYDLIANGMQATMKIELTAYNSGAATFTKTTTISAAGQSQASVEAVKAEELNSSEDLTAFLSMCESSQVGGQYQTISGIQTCFIAQQEGTVNIGVVPFGIVRAESSEGSIELTRYGYGK